MKAKIIAFANRKGGVGKTTSVSSLGGVAASRRKKVLFVDMDSQANLTGNFLAETPEHTIVDMFADRKRRLPVMRIRENLFLVPGDCDIAGLESALSTAEDRLILSAALEKVREEYDYILIDCPPDLGWCTINALSACDFLFVPMMMDAKSFQGVGMMTEFCYQSAKRTFINGIFFTSYDTRKNITKRYEAKVRSRYGDTVMRSAIRVCSRLAECADDNKDIVAFDPCCNGAADYAALWDEMLLVMGEEDGNNA